MSGTTPTRSDGQSACRSRELDLDENAFPEPAEKLTFEQGVQKIVDFFRRGTLNQLFLYRNPATSLYEVNIGDVWYRFPEDRSLANRVKQGLEIPGQSVKFQSEYTFESPFRRADERHYIGRFVCITRNA